MSLTEKESRQVVKLLRLALDNRGSEKQADMAAQKALAICRARGVELEDVAELITPSVVREVQDPFAQMQSKFGVVFAENLFAEVDDLLNSLRPKRRGRA